MGFLRSLTFLLGFLTLTLTVLLFSISFFLLTLVWLSFHWENLIMLLSQFPLTFQQTQNRMPCVISYLMNILVLTTGTVFVIIWEMFHGEIFLNSVLLLLLVNSVSRFRLELMYIYLTVNIWSNLLISMVFSCFCCCHSSYKSIFFVCANRINLLNLK